MGNDEEYQLLDALSNFLQEYDTDLLNNNQEDFLLYLDTARNLAWDIPSAFPCDHLQDLGLEFGDEAPMHHYVEADLDEFKKKWPSLVPGVKAAIKFWEAANIHFKEVHGLDLTDDRINWQFDT
jgi:hypothetical protein